MGDPLGDRGLPGGPNAQRIICKRLDHPTELASIPPRTPKQHWPKIISGAGLAPIATRGAKGVLGLCCPSAQKADMGKHGDNDSEEEFAGGGDGASSGPLVPSFARKRRRCCGESDDIGVELQCYLCSEALDSTKGKKWKGLLFDSRCFNALRSHRRILEKFPAALAQSDALAISDPYAWREQVLLLVKSDGDGTRTAALSKVRAKARKVEEYENSEEIKDKVLLTKRRFKAHMAWWEGTASDEASEEWNDEFEKLRSQGISYKNGKGQHQVAIPENTRIRKSKGKRSTADPDARGQGSRGRSPSRASTNASAAAASRPRVAARSSMSGTARSAAMPGSAMGGHRGGELAEESEGEASDEGMISDAPSAITHRSATRSPDSKGKAIGFDTFDLSQAAQQRHNKQLSPVELIQEKAALRAKIEKVLKEQEGKRGIKARIEASDKQLTDDQRKDLEVSSSEAVLPLDRATKHLKDVRARLDNVKVGTMDEIKEAVQKAMAALSAETKTCEDFHKALGFLVGQSRLQNRHSMMQVRYRRAKVVNRLIVGGFGKGFAKNMPDHFYQQELPRVVKVSPEEFDHVAILMWDSSGQSEQPKMLKQIARFQEESLVMVPDKQARMLEELGKNSAWTGCMSKVDKEGRTFDFEPWGLGGDPMVNMAGCKPWLAAFKKETFKFGPKAFPLPGLGSFVVAVSPMVLQLFTIEPLLAKGISLPDVPQFLEAPAGATYIKETLLTVPMKKGTAMWVPYGYVCITINTPLDPEGSVEDFGFARVLTILEKSWAQELPANVWAAIRAWNEETFKANSSSKLWGDRAEAFAELCEE